MKTCPNCKAEIEENYDLCWKCNYSFSENQVVEIKEIVNGNREIDCLRCNTPMVYTGLYKFHEGAMAGVWGSFFEIFQNREHFEIYLCPKCGKVEFFAPIEPRV